MPTPEITRRTFFLAALSTLGLGGLAVTQGRMTLGANGKFQQSLLAQSARRVELIAPRGRILDRAGRELAGSRPAYAAYLGYPDFKDENRVRELCSLLGLVPDAVLDALRPIVKGRNYWLPVLIKDDLSEQEYTRISEDRDHFHDVLVTPRQVRIYPYGTLAAHILGYTGRPDEAAILKGISPNDHSGRVGLESRYDSDLRGKTGKQDVQINFDGTPTGRASAVKPVVAGQDLHLTLDAQLQYVAEQSLSRTLAKIRAERNNDGNTYKNAHAGAVVAMDPRSGAVLAMASYPSYDPNWFAAGDRRVSAVFADVHSPLFGRAWQGAYNPGSTWKPLTSAAALRENVITTGSRVSCTGVFDRVHPSPKCWSVHGNIGVMRALAESCDVFFYEMGFRLGIEKLTAMAEEFGFGQLTGIDLQDEVAGWLPTAENRAQSNEWDTIGSTLFAAIGQKIEASPLALARFACTLANGGKVLRPQLVMQRGPDGVPVPPAPEVQREINVSKEILAVIHQGMRAVTGPGGTAEGRFAALGVPVAGKTGTAEMLGQDPYGVFIAYAPAENPTIAIAVVGEQAGHGDSMIPVVKAVMAQALGISLPPGDEAYLPNRTLPAPQS